MMDRPTLRPGVTVRILSLRPNLRNPSQGPVLGTVGCTGVVLNRLRGPGAGGVWSVAVAGQPRGREVYFYYRDELAIVAGSANDAAPVE